MPETMMSGAILMHSAELAAGDNASEVCFDKDSAIWTRSRRDGSSPGLFNSDFPQEENRDLTAGCLQQALLVGKMASIFSTPFQIPVRRSWVS